MFEGYVASEEAKVRTKLAERRAAENWRFRHLKSKESQLLSVLMTALIGLFVR